MLQALCHAQTDSLPGVAHRVLAGMAAALASRASIAIGFALIALCIAGKPSRAVEVVFDYRFDERGFFDDPLRRALLDRAAQEYTGPLDSQLGALSPHNFRARLSNPDTGDLVSLETLGVPEQTLVVFVGARPLWAGGRIAVGGPGYTQFPCKEVIDRCISQMTRQHDPGELRSNLFEVVFRSSVGALQYPARAFATWGGSLAFGSDVAWYFGEDSDVPPDQFDFLSSAIHELGHVFGIGTAESWSTRVPSRAFEGERSVSAHGGTIPLHNDFGHWKNGTQSWANGVPQEAAFTPGLAPGQRLWLSELDLAALRDIGWVMADEPPVSFEPAANYASRRIKGDVDGDGIVSHADIQYVLIQLEIDAQSELAADSESAAEGPPNREEAPIGPLDDPFARAAADVFPMEDGNAMGDGVVDERDVQLLREASRTNDIDGDGLSFLMENILNQGIWMGIIGRPRYQPLNHWTEACIESIPFLSQWQFMMTSGTVTFMYCGRDGTPWAMRPGLSPEECCDGPEPVRDVPRTKLVDNSSEVEPEMDDDPTSIEPEVDHTSTSEIELPESESEPKLEPESDSGFIGGFVQLTQSKKIGPPRQRRAIRSRAVDPRAELGPELHRLEFEPSDPVPQARPVSVSMAFAQTNPIERPRATRPATAIDPRPPPHSVLADWIGSLLESIQRFGVWLAAWFG